MTERIDNEGMEALSSAECDRLLRPGGVGILALRGDEEPILRPVNFAVHEKWIMMRTGVGQIFAAAENAEHASFVLMQTDAVEHIGWSIVIRGMLSEHQNLMGVPYFPLRPWAASEKNNFVGLSMDEVSGRRVVPHVGEQ